MKTSDRIVNSRRPRGVAATVLSSIIVFAVTDGHTAGSHDIDAPASSEFGSGPRTSVGDQYAATLRMQESLRPRQMQTIRVLIQDAGGRAVDGAAITVDGGMPQHGHGLPTNPRVTENLRGGIYEIEGVRFNLGGWWEFKLTIDGPSGGPLNSRNGQDHVYEVWHCGLGASTGRIRLRRIPAWRGMDCCADRGTRHDVPDCVDFAIRPNEPRGR